MQPPDEREIGVDVKLVADQLGHEVDVDINTYTLTSVELRQAAVNRLESFVGAKQCSNGAQEIGNARNLLELSGAGDRGRTGDVQLGKMGHVLFSVI